MDIYLDREPFSFDETSATVGQVLKSVLHGVHADGRVVTCIRCDGEEVDADALNAILPERADKFGRLEFESGMPGQLAVEALSHVQAMLIELESAKEQAVERLNQGQTSEAMMLLRTYFDAWHQAHDAVLQSVKLVGVNMDAMSVDELSIAELFEQFANQLRQLKEALEARDHVTLADIMNYEANETTERWIKLIEQIKTACDER